MQNKNDEILSLLHACRKIPAEDAAGLRNGLLSVLLTECDDFEHADGAFTFLISGERFRISERYVSAYLGEEMYRRVSVKDGSGMPMEWPEGEEPDTADEIRDRLSALLRKLPPYRETAARTADESRLQKRIDELTRLNKELTMALQAEKEARQAERDRFTALLAMSSGSASRGSRNQEERPQSPRPKDFDREQAERPPKPPREESSFSSRPDDPEEEARRRIKEAERMERRRMRDAARRPEEEGSFLKERRERRMPRREEELERQAADMHRDLMQNILDDVAGPAKAPVPAPQTQTDAVSPVSEPRDAQSENSGDRESAAGEYGIFPFKDDIYEMTKKEFMFTWCPFSILNEQEEEVESAELIVVPLNSKVEHPALMVWVAYNRTTDTICTEDGDNAAEIAIGKFRVHIGGHMNKDLFRAEVTMDEVPGHTLKVRYRPNGKRGHLYLDDEGCKIHVSPVTFENGEDDFANFIYAIEKDGEIIECGDNMDHEIFYENNGHKQLMVRWQENTLCAGVQQLS